MTSLADPIETAQLEPVEEESWNSVQEEERETPLQPWQWTRELYYKAADAGIFKPGEKLELIDGKVYRQVSPQHHPHSTSVYKSVIVLRKIFGEEYMVREEKPILLSDKDEPEPDIAVILGDPDDYEDHPTADVIVLVMEVSDSTYAKDSRFKASLYASFGIPDYWVLNVNKRWLEVRREPYEESKARFGFAYKEVKRYTEDEKVTPLGAPSREILVQDMLPRLHKTEAAPSED